MDLIIFVILLTIFIGIIKYVMNDILLWVLKLKSKIVTYIYNKIMKYNILDNQNIENAIIQHKIGRMQSVNLIQKEVEYETKDFLTEYEEYFYHILLELESELDIRVQSQVNLATIINKVDKFQYQNELFRNIDFGIFTKDCKKVLLLIEINDKTHTKYERIIRDKKVKEILEKANIKLLTFYSSMPNEKQYVKNRVKKELICLLNNE